MNDHMRIQIYGIRTPEDAVMVTEAGADHIGVSYGPIVRLKGQRTFEQAKEIFDAVEGKVTRVGLTVATDLEEIVEMVTTVMPDILHLSGLIDPFPPDQVAALKERVPGLKVMQAIPVSGPKALEYVRQYEKVSDYFLLDTKNEDATDIGATGLTHDWQLDKQIVESTSVPCIMAGGLDAANVADAIKFVHPWGVDSFSHTNFDQIPVEGGIKDPEKVQEFIQAVREATK